MKRKIAAVQMRQNPWTWRQHLERVLTPEEMAAHADTYATALQTPEQYLPMQQHVDHQHVPVVSEGGTLIQVALTLHMISNMNIQYCDTPSRTYSPNTFFHDMNFISQPKLSAVPTTATCLERNVARAWRQKLLPCIVTTCTYHYTAAQKAQLRTWLNCTEVYLTLKVLLWMKLTHDAIKSIMEKVVEVNEKEGIYCNAGTKEGRCMYCREYTKKTD